jgi:hypothetical protein
MVHFEPSICCFMRLRRKWGRGGVFRAIPASVLEGFVVRLRRVFTPIFLFRFIVRQRDVIICK